MNCFTPQERMREDRELEAKGLKVFSKEKKEWKFMQKYYHKGVFYMDEDTIARDAAGALPSDNRNIVVVDAVCVTS
jgi:microfibrillar-associated protein 1